MKKLSQGKKIAISALAMFAVSLAAMLFFLGGDMSNPAQGKVSVIHAEESGETAVVPKRDYSEYIADEEIPYFVTSAEGVFVYASPDFCRFLGKRCSDLMGHKFVDYINSKDHSEVLSFYTKLIQSGKKIDGIGPFRMIHKDKERLILFTAQPISEDEKVVEIFFTTKDLTDQVNDLKEDEENTEGDWIDHLYPKIREMGDGDASRLMVEKISYAKD